MIPTIFDVETAPLPEKDLMEIMPVFEPAGNLKDPEKIKASIEAKRKSWLEDAALSPVTGRVLAVGVLQGTKPDIYGLANESSLLVDWWALADVALSAGGQLVGFNCNSFDLPFLIKRSWKLGVAVPKIVGGWSGRYWNWNEQIIDLRLIWQLGDKQAGGGLDEISKFFGEAGKTGLGKDFSGLWESDRPKAVAYLEQDLKLAARLYQAMMT